MLTTKLRSTQEKVNTVKIYPIKVRRYVLSWFMYYGKFSCSYSRIYRSLQFQTMIQVYLAPFVDY